MTFDHAGSGRKVTGAGESRRSDDVEVSAVQPVTVLPVPVAGLNLARGDQGALRKPVRRTVATSSPILGVIRRTKADFQNGYIEGYQYNSAGEPQGFVSGLRDGLAELVQGGFINRQAAGQILQGHQWAVQYPTGWDADFNRHADDEEQFEDGRVAGYAFGFDQGYEEALSQYGYARQYAAIPQANIRAALQDNNGKCVYCNVNANADVDHVYPLKWHWKTRGATMGAARSNEANHLNNLVGACANCNRSKGSKLLLNGWNPPAWPAHQWWPFGPLRAQQNNSPPPYW